MPHLAVKPMKTFLFACVHNAGRSQMAAAIFNLYGNRDECCAISADTRPASQVHPEVVTVMREIGIDLSIAKPQLLTNELTHSASVLITMGCGEACPFVPGLRTLDWALPDPKSQSIDDVRAIRNEIHDRVKALLRSECADCVVGSTC
jgi:arsenate reductase